MNLCECVALPPQLILPSLPSAPLLLPLHPVPPPPLLLPLAPVLDMLGSWLLGGPQAPPPGVLRCPPAGSCCISDPCCMPRFCAGPCHLGRKLCSAFLMFACLAAMVASALTRLPPWCSHDCLQDNLCNLLGLQ